MLAAEHGVRFIVGHAVGTHEKVKEYLDDFQARGVDAVISIFHNHPDYSETVLIELKQFEHVVFFEKPGEAFGPDPFYVQPDYFEAGRLGVQHLIDRGRRRIGFVFSSWCSRMPFSGNRPTSPQSRGRAGQSTGSSSGSSMSRRLSIGARHHAGTGMRAVDVLLEREVDGIVAVNDLYAARRLAPSVNAGAASPGRCPGRMRQPRVGHAGDATLTTLGFDIDNLPNG